MSKQTNKTKTRENTEGKKAKYFQIQFICNILAENMN